MSYFYFLSFIECDPYYEYSFEKVLENDYVKFLLKKERQLFLGEIIGRHNDIIVYYGNEWKLTRVLDENEIKSIDILWKLLPHKDRIIQCINDN